MTPTPKPAITLATPTPTSLAKSGDCASCKKDCQSDYNHPGWGEAMSRLCQYQCTDSDGVTCDKTPWWSCVGCQELCGDRSGEEDSWMQCEAACMDKHPSVCARDLTGKAVSQTAACDSCMSNCVKVGQGMKHYTYTSWGEGSDDQYDNSNKQIEALNNNLDYANLGKCWSECDVQCRATPTPTPISLNAKTPSICTECMQTCKGMIGSKYTKCLGDCAEQKGQVRSACIPQSTLLPSTPQPVDLSSQWTDHRIGSPVDSSTGGSSSPAPCSGCPAHQYQCGSPGNCQCCWEVP
jgi:hypothetical protein